MIRISTLDKSRSLHHVTELHSHLIRDHHFFEGHTAYRLDPQLAIEVLDIQPGVDYKLKTRHEKNWIFYSSESRFEKEELEAAKQHAIESSMHEEGEFVAYLLPYSNWSSYKYRRLTYRQKAETQGRDEGKSPEEIEKNIQRIARFMTDDDLDLPVWESDGQRYLHIFCPQQLSQNMKRFKKKASTIGRQWFAVLDTSYVSWLGKIA